MVSPNLSVIPEPSIPGIEATPWVGSFASSANAPVILVTTRVRDTDLFDNVQHSFNHFIQSGQAWALVIGFVLGYFLRGLTR